jgi:hypothetical protein
MTWQQFLQTYGGGERPRIKEARDWLRGGVSERDAWDNEERADNLLWLARELGYCDQETLDSVACALVERVAPVREFKGEEVKPVKREIKIEVGGGDEPEMVESDEIDRGVYAASFLLTRNHVKAATFSLRAKTLEAQAAWCAAMADQAATKAEKQELQAAVERVRSLENAEQCKVVRSMIGGPSI